MDTLLQTLLVAQHAAWSNLLANFSSVFAASRQKIALAPRFGLH